MEMIRKKRGSNSPMTYVDNWRNKARLVNGKSDINGIWSIYIKKMKLYMNINNYLLILLARYLLIIKDD